MIIPKPIIQYPIVEENNPDAVLLNIDKLITSPMAKIMPNKIVNHAILIYIKDENIIQNFYSTFGNGKLSKFSLIV